MFTVIFDVFGQHFLTVTMSYIVDPIIYQILDTVKDSSCFDVKCSFC